MPVVEYKLHKVNRGITTPTFISDGGQWYSPINFSFIGWVEPENNRNYYVPDSLSEMTKQDLIDRQLAIHAVEPMINESTEVAYTDAEVTALISDWYDAYVSEK